MKKKILAIIGITLVLSMTTGVTAAKTETLEENKEETLSTVTEEDFLTLQEEHAELEEQVTTLTEKNTELEGQVTTLTEKNTELEEQIATLTDENEQLKKQVEELNSSEAPLDEEKEEVTEEKSEQETEDAETTEIVVYEDTLTIRMTQEALNAAGFDCGTPDGVAGGNTSKAITEYQTAKGLTVNGLVTDEVLKSLDIVEKVQKAVENEEKKNEYQSGYTYDQLARNPDTHKGTLLKMSGKVLQAQSIGDGMSYARIALNSDYNTVLFVTYEDDVLGYRLLEDDRITVYGTSMGVYSYEAVSGATITIPWINADMIDMN